MWDLLKFVPFVVISSGVTWVGQAYAYQARTKKGKIEHEDRLEIHRDELTFELLQSARAEMTFARAEIEALRKEVNTLRDLERHVYHFQQSLDHLEAILMADTLEARQMAERNARAFLNRMRRLSDAKGTIANEVQRADSEMELQARSVPFFKGTDDVQQG